ncbi:MAG: hypothetical protein NC433_07735 [Clostridiales bacterium]|nr:hypothetical protein [Clostridiales bacterium]
MGRLSEQLCFNYKKDYFKEISDWKNSFPSQKLYIWGVGSVANGVIRELEKRRISIEGCFVNVENYNLDSRIAAKELPIVRLDDLLLEGIDFSVIVGHSHYELVDMLKKYHQIKNIWCLNNVSRDDVCISPDFIKENINILEQNYEMLEDKISRKNMVAFLNSMLSGDNSWIYSSFKYATSYFDNDIITFSNEEVYLDLGAYNGESTKKFIEKCPDYKQIICVEVQTEMCKKLIDEYKENERITICNMGISDHEGEDYFCFDAQSTCLASHGGIALPVTTVDALCRDIYRISMIKMCIGNTIIPLLNGAKATLCSYTPKLIITAGVGNRALVDYIPKIEELSGGKKYSYYLRFTNPATECLVLYAVPKEG